jgi:hypothetical protein
MILRHGRDARFHENMIVKEYQAKEIRAEACLVNCHRNEKKTGGDSIRAPPAVFSYRSN